MSKKLQALRAWAGERQRALILTAFIFIACGISWSTGYLAAADGGRSPIVIEKCSQQEV